MGNETKEAALYKKARLRYQISKIVAEIQTYPLGSEKIHEEYPPIEHGRAYPDTEEALNKLQGILDQVSTSETDR